MLCMFSSLRHMPEQAEFSFDLKVAQEAAERWERTAPERETNIAEAAAGGLAAAETKPRLMKRATRLVRMVARTASVNPDLSSTVASLVQNPAAVDELDKQQLEAVIGETSDFLSVEFLEHGAEVCSSVCRTASRQTPGTVKFGTGFLVSPHLLMTNHHVIRSEQEAATTVAEFGFELRNGLEMPVHSFQLDPAAFFLTNDELDFTIVAVRPTSRDGQALAGFGFCPLIAEEGKVMLTEAANIIQHPSGRAKQVVVRQNRLLHLLPKFFQYEADTEPGSSGSPVFNDQWEVVALHHSGIPKRDENKNLLNKSGGIWQEGDDPKDLAWEANEGIRVSALFSFIQGAVMPDEQKALRNELLGAQRPEAAVVKPMTTTTNEDDKQFESAGDTPAPQHSYTSSAAQGYANGAVTITIPLQITVSLGGLPAASGAQISHRVTPGAEPDNLEASIHPDPDYTNRPGFQTGFLSLPVPLPTLKDTKLGKPLPQVLKYFHYSVLLNEDRKMAYVSAVNYFAKAPVSYSRTGPDKWFEDPRAKGFQTDESLYAGNPLDRGHLTRRADAAWGATQAEAKLANDDTFHFSNCTPQHEVFNQGQKAAAQGLKLWGNLETYVQDQAKANQGKVSVLNGPVFRASDRPYRGILLPKEFYKVICYVSDTGKLRAAAFILSQEALLKTVALEDLVWTPYKPFQVKLSLLETRTHLDFGALRAADALTGLGLEAFEEGLSTEAIAIESLDNIVL